MDNPTSKIKLTEDEGAEKLQEKLKTISDKGEEEEAENKARQAGLSYVNLVHFPIAPEALVLLSQEDALKYRAICFYAGERDAKVGFVKADDQIIKEAKQLIESLYRLKVEVFLISQTSFDYSYKLYTTLPKISKFATGVEITEENLKKYQVAIKTFRDLDQKIKEVSISDIIILIVAAALQSRSSDIHIEAEETDVKIRFRVDGVLIDVASLPKSFWKQVVTRIKLLSALKINIIDKPQDGRFTIHLSGENIDVRVSCLPTAFGESVVMRILRSSATGLSFENLGLRGTVYEKLKEEVERPNGMIITTGPTGSGKTTTLYAILNKLNNQETKIITLEDPVEYQLKGINQSQVDPSRNYTFSAGLRSILRQDPDVVMVGEVRDLETAEIAIQAALTGHLVVSTLHTNDAPGAIPRFLSMGVKPYLLAPAINAIIGQRLVRRVCEYCKQEITLAPEVLEKVKKNLSNIPPISGVKIDLDNLKFYHGLGCDKCQGLGYNGRVGIYEVFTMNAEIEKVIVGGEVSEYLIRDLAKKQGMLTMAQDGILKALDGITTVEEVFRVTE
ncbi:MAG: GspE/PulE family protein [Patescibacteria group bacterium]